MTWFERAIWGSKVLVVFVGMASTVTLLKTTVIPYFQYLTFSILPRLWMSFRSWVCPLYIYLVLNFIIFVIAATSTFPHSNPAANDSQSAYSSSSSSSEDNTKNIKQIHNQKSLKEENHHFSHGIISWRSFHILQEKKGIADESSPEAIENRSEDDGVVVGREDLFYVSEAESVDEYSTLEATWKAIMERQGKTEEAQKLTKSDAAPLARADHHHHEILLEDDDNENAVPVLMGKKKKKKKKMMNKNKWETLSELRKDKSMSEEELSKRAEAFINKVNNDIRLQRLESDQRFRDMVNRGL